MMTLQSGTTGPPPGTITALLADMHHAADHGLGLSAIAASTAANLLGLDTLTLCLVTADGQLELVWSDQNNRLGAELDDVQYTQGEGPSIDAARLGHTVSVPNLATAVASRWPAFQPAALLRARAVIAIPLVLGAGPIGVLTGYRIAPSLFPDEQLHKLKRFARALVRLLLQTHMMDPLVFGPEIRKDLTLHRTEVHQATGILTVQLGIPLGPALALLRAYAYSHDRPLLSVARDIIAHRLRLPPP